MLGGYMTWGIPAFRCPPEVFHEDIDRMLARCPGIPVHLGVGLDRGVTLDELKERHDAVLLDDRRLVGEGHADRERRRPSRRSTASSSCVGSTAASGPPMPSRVIVVGAGDVAMDACRGRQAAARLRGRAGAVPPRPRRDPGAQGRALGRDRGGHRDPLQRPAGRRLRGTAAGFVLRCVAHRARASPATTGAVSPIDVPSSEHDYECGLVIMAIGQRTVSEHLDELRADGRREGAHGLGLDAHRRSEGLRRGRRRLRAVDDRHGDAPRPPRRLLRQAVPGGRPNPLPYRTPYKTRRVPVAQDALWEVFAREHQEFHGLGENPIEFPEIESGYTDETAKREAARCYRCDAETGSSDYNVRTREDIFVMARTKPDGRAEAARGLHAAAHRLEGDPLPPRGREPRRHRLPAGQPVAARHRPLPRRLSRRDRARRRAG